MILLDADNFSAELNRFYGCHDSILHSIKVNYSDDTGELLEVIITLECRYDSNAHDWKRIDFLIHGAESIKLEMIANSSNRVISDGVSIINYNHLLCLVLNNSGTEIEDVSDLKYANIYVIGRRIELISSGT